MSAARSRGLLVAVCAAAFAFALLIAETILHPASRSNPCRTGGWLPRYNARRFTQGGSPVAHVRILGQTT
jgi:hypothetical protein